MEVHRLHSCDSPDAEHILQDGMVLCPDGNVYAMLVNEQSSCYFLPWTTRRRNYIASSLKAANGCLLCD